MVQTLRAFGTDQWLAKQDVKPLYIEKIDPLQFKQWIIEKT